MRGLTAPPSSSHRRLHRGPAAHAFASARAAAAVVAAAATAAAATTARGIARAQVDLPTCNYSKQTDPGMMTTRNNAEILMPPPGGLLFVEQFAEQRMLNLDAT